jgi:Recombination endonuclease VII
MSLTLWNKLPQGFLKKQFRAWDRLNPDVKHLIVKLAEAQKFKCACCPRERNLIIEHDHDPEFGSGDRPTAFNIRGLVCQRCNWHLMIYEKDLNGEYRGFDEVSSYISHHEWETYIYAYDGRIVGLHESQLEGRMGTLKYLRRRIFLDKFDDWQEWGARKRSYPWYWGFAEMKERKRRRIRTPEQFLNALALARIMGFLEELYPTIEARYLELKQQEAGATAAV